LRFRAGKLPVGGVSTGGSLLSAATGVEFRHAVGQTGVCPRIFCKLACGPRWQNCRIRDLSCVPKFGMPHDDAITCSARPHNSDTVLATRGSSKPRP
jgi:hypothetical protein